MKKEDKMIKCKCGKYTNYGSSCVRCLAVDSASDDFKSLLEDEFIEHETDFEAADDDDDDDD